MNDLHLVYRRHLTSLVADQEHEKARHHRAHAQTPIKAATLPAPLVPTAGPAPVYFDEIESRTMDIAPGDLNAMGFYAMRPLSDGHWLALEPMTFGRVRMGLSASTGDTAEEAFALGYADVWEFATKPDAELAFAEYDNMREPQGWMRHPMTSRRRQPDGTVQVRARELQPQLLARLRHAVASGTVAHECQEWIAEPYGATAGRCVLCDAVVRQWT